MYVKIRLVLDRETGKPKGYGFCEFRDEETALSARRNLQGYEINGRQLRVDFAENEKGGGGDRNREQVFFFFLVLVCLCTFFVTDFSWNKKGLRGTLHTINGPSLLYFSRLYDPPLSSRLSELTLILMVVTSLLIKELVLDLKFTSDLELLPLKYGFFKD